MREWTIDRVDWKFALLLSVAVCVMYYVLILAKAQVDLEIEVDQRTWFKIYYAAANEPFSEKRMAKVRVMPGREKYHFRLANLGAIDQLRIDTHEYTGRAMLRSLTIRQEGFSPLVLDAKREFTSLIPHFHIADSRVKDDGLLVESSGNDPSFILQHNGFQRTDINIVEEGVQLVAFGLLVLLLYVVLGRLENDYSYVPVGLAIAVVLAATMATVSKENSHPDEFVHVAAVKYYSNHWLPPEIDDQSINDSYSPYGVSRLHGKEIYYLLAGKVSTVFEHFYFNKYTSSRMFNVLLLLCITLYVTHVVEARIMAVPLLISPQIWYVYSYCNSDAFALTVCFFLACQIVLPGSMFNRFLSERVSLGWAWQGGVVGLLLGSLLLVKNNYLPFTALIFFIIFLFFMQLSDRDARIQFFTRIFILFLIGASLTVGKKYSDYVINGPDRDVRISAARSAHSDRMHDPQTDLEQKHPSLSMKARGVTLKALIMNYRWFEKSFRSAFGVYGYMEISGTENFYDVMRWSAVVLMCFFFAGIFLRGQISTMLCAGVALCLSLALVAASLYHSWVADFQPQGRYLFPIIGMLCILCGQNREILSKRWMGLLVSWMFCLSLYSFISYGLLRIARTIAV